MKETGVEKVNNHFHERLWPEVNVLIDLCSEMYSKVDLTVASFKEMTV